MAYIDVKEHYYQVTRQFLDAAKTVNTLVELYKNNSISEEQFQVGVNNYEIIKMNYIRIAGIMELFRKPKSRKNRIKFLPKFEELDEFLLENKAAPSSVFDENEEVLADFKQYVEKITSYVDKSLGELNEQDN